MQGNRCREAVEVLFMHFCFDSDFSSALFSRRSISGELCKGKPVIVANVASGHRTFTDSVCSEVCMTRWSRVSAKGFRSTTLEIFLSTKGCSAAMSDVILQMRCLQRNRRQNLEQSGCDAEGSELCDIHSVQLDRSCLSLLWRGRKRVAREEERSSRCVR